LEVKGKKTEKDGQKIVLTYCESGDKNCRCGGHNLDAGGVGLTKAEAWKAEIELVEGRIKRKEAEIAEDRECLDRYKAELAKAKEEEEEKKVWIVRLFVGDVYKASREEGDRVFGVDGYSCHKTKQEAYSALAEYYKGKYEEALVKSGKAKFAIRCGDKISLVQDVEKDDKNRVWASDFDGFLVCLTEENVFNTRQEAEAEVKKRKK
jgi:hypothetical protein